MRIVLLVFVLVSALLPRHTAAFGMIGSKGIGMGRTVVLSHSSATTLVNVPGGIVRSGWMLEGGYNRRFELSDLDHLFLAGAVRWRNLTVAVGASQFGKPELYAEQLLKGSFAICHDSLVVGGSLSAMQVQIGGGYVALRAATCGLGVSYRTRRLLLAAEADNLTRPSLIHGSVKREPLYSVYAEMIGLGSYSVTARATLVKRQKPQFALGQVIRLSKRGSFFWGISTKPLEFGGGIELSIRSGTVSYATSIHPVLGFSHTVSFAYGSGQDSSPTGDGFE